MFVYVIVNDVNLKIYIGKTTTSNLQKYLQDKISQSKYEVKRGRAIRSHLFNAIRKYGREHFHIHPLFKGQTNEEICDHEKLLIKALAAQNSEVGYNICRGGEGFTGPHTEEWKRKVSERMKAIGNRPPVSVPIDMTGMIVNGIVVLGKAAPKNMYTVRRTMRNYWKIHWLCRCRCGKIFTTLGASLRNGHTKSCGCSLIERLEGKKFGSLTVLKLSAVQKRWTTWECRCDCGAVKDVLAGNIKKYGNTTSCRCHHPKKLSINVGQRFGLLTVLSRTTNIGKRSQWVVQCDCGSTKEIRGDSLTTGTKSCGCLMREYRRQQKAVGIVDIC
jgi:GIY-YIG catalytic domain